MLYVQVNDDKENAKNINLNEISLRDAWRKSDNYQLSMESINKWYN